MKFLNKRTLQKISPWRVLVDKSRQINLPYGKYGGRKEWWSHIYIYIYIYIYNTRLFNPEIIIIYIYIYTHTYI